MKNQITNLLIKIDIWRTNFRRKNRFTAWLCDSARFFLMVIVILAIIVLAAIGLKSYFEHSDNHTVVMEMQQDHIEGTDLYRIENSNLYYDQNTRVVYYVIFTQDSVYSRSFGLMSEYYSDNLKKCKYIDGQIQEAE